MKIEQIDRRTAAIVSAFALQVFFFAPLRVFLNNTTDFAVGLSHVLVALLLVSTTLLAVLYVAGMLWPRVLLPAVIFLTSSPFWSSPYSWVWLGTGRSTVGRLTGRHSALLRLLSWL